MFIQEKKTAIIGPNHTLIKTSDCCYQALRCVLLCEIRTHGSKFHIAY